MRNPEGRDSRIEVPARFQSIQNQKCPPFAKNTRQPSYSLGIAFRRIGFAEKCECLCQKQADRPGAMIIERPIKQVLITSPLVVSKLFRPMHHKRCLANSSRADERYDPRADRFISNRLVPGVIELT